jgi:hypothetical protein
VDAEEHLGIATVDEIEGVRHGTNGDTGRRCGDVPWCKLIVRPGCGRRLGTVACREVSREASNDRQTPAGMQWQRASVVRLDRSDIEALPAGRRWADPRGENGGRGFAKGFRCVRNTNLLPPFFYQTYLVTMHVTPESMFLHRPARGKHDLAHSYITETPPHQALRRLPVAEVHACDAPAPPQLVNPVSFTVPE